MHEAKPFTDVCDDGYRLTPPRADDRHLSVPEQASFLAARAIAYATAHLDGRDSAQNLALHADALQAELMTGWSGVGERELTAILTPVRLLVTAMARAALATTTARQDRWQHVMGALVELVRHENGALRGSVASATGATPSGSAKPMPSSPAREAGEFLR